MGRGLEAGNTSALDFLSVIVDGERLRLMRSLLYAAFRDEGALCLQLIPMCSISNGDDSGTMSIYRHSRGTRGRRQPEHLLKGTHLSLVLGRQLLC